MRADDVNRTMAANPAELCVLNYLGVGDLKRCKTEQASGRVYGKELDEPSFG